jgi:hypothetical protein
VTQPRHAQPADFLVTAVHNASRAGLTMAVVVVALIGADAAVAVHRTAHSNTPGTAAVAQPTGITTPGGGYDPSSSPQPLATSAAARVESYAAKALLKSALENALSKGSVHAVARFTTKHGTAIFDNRAATHHGVQHLTIYGGHVTIRVIGSTTYYTGDKRGLVKFLTYKPKVAALFHHRWVPLIDGNKGYRVLTEGVTLASLLSSERLAGPLRRLPERVIDGTTVVGLQGRGAGSGVRKHSIATWWVTTGRHSLPVEFDASNANSRLTQSFTQWGKPIRVKRPKGIF